MRSSILHEKALLLINIEPYKPSYPQLSKESIRVSQRDKLFTGEHISVFLHYQQEGVEFVVKEGGHGNVGWHEAVDQGVFVVVVESSYVCSLVVL